MANMQTKTGGVIMDSVSITDAGVNSTAVNSDVVDISRSTNVSLDLLTDAYNDVTGTIAVQGCNDLTPTSPNWVAIEFSDGSTSVAVAASTSKLFDLQNLGCKFLRVVFTGTGAGTGTNTLRVVSHVKHNVGV